jgi:outer membrane protein assembly factor BamB
MNHAPTMSISADSPPAARLRHGARYKWFPILLIAAALFGWLRRGGWDAGFTVYYLGFGLGLIVLLSLWFLPFGWGSFRARLALVLPVWLLLSGLVVCFRPINNGSLVIVGWQPRFAGSPEFEKRGLADNWRTTPHDYPRFLGAEPWAEVPDVRLDTNWQAHPPQEVWRREIGEGWSSFAVVGDYAFTQEQRGDNEFVSCYRLDDGQLVWARGDRVRFGPNDFKGSVGGVGPRATPTVYDGKVITQGATGQVSCRDARTGDLLWSHDTTVELGADLPAWGKSGSPIVVDDLAIVSVGAPADPDKRAHYNASLVAYDLETGRLRWSAGHRQASYATPVLADLAGERQILVINEQYLSSHRLSDGRLLWEYPWGNENDLNASVSQPIPLPDDRVFLSKGYGIGASLLEVVHNDAGQLEPRPLWQPALIPVMKTKMNNVVIRDGYVYGLDDTLLECVDLASGKVMWKKRRRPALGYGQLLLVGDTLLVLSETGELVAAEVSPAGYKELGSEQILDPGEVTWNNPVFAAPYLLARNAHEAVCYRLPFAEAASVAAPSQQPAAPPPAADRQGRQQQ